MPGKLDSLKSLLKEIPALAVAYSGGVDSSLLLKMAHDCLGNNAIAITAVGVTFPQRELAATREFCSTLGIKQYIIKTDPLKIAGFSENKADRCYLCKIDIFTRIIQKALELGIEKVADGSNQDDLEDFRPGLQAIKELDILTPLLQVGLNKSEIRKCARELGVPSWDKPAAACLASRFPQGETIAARKIEMVEQAENLLIDLGFKQVRVRMHGDLARIEFGINERIKIADSLLMDRINARILELGFKYATFDLGGYKCGG